jgi:hypothetical protein
MVLDRAREIVAEYDSAITLRQLWYRLKSLRLLPSDTSASTVLSRKTADARRAGTFPRLVDDYRGVIRHHAFTSPLAARQWLHRTYRRDRTEGQEWSVWIVLEKNALASLIFEWFGDYGIGVLPIRGYDSQGNIDEVIEELEEARREYKRPAVVLYAGDCDPSGEDLRRDFFKRCPAFDKQIIVALTEKQIDHYKLDRLPPKEKDGRNERFKAAHHGQLFCVELDALAPSDLRALFTAALAPFIDYTMFERSLRREKRDRKELDPMKGGKDER